MEYQNTRDFALSMDANDPLKAFREKFFIPQADGKDMIYFTGNSLGLQPKSTEAFLKQELEDWKNLGVEGHFHGKNPWYYYHHFLQNQMAVIVGAKPSEVVAMNSLSTNLNLMMVSFYRPKGNRTKILIEQSAFPSDIYAVQQQIKFHGGNPETDLIEVKADENEYIATAAFLEAIETHKDSLALIMIGGVNYYTGQFFDIKTITKAAHDAGAVAGWDLAHAAGNVHLQLHDWEVDFAAWCSYKYLNSGPGGISGIFVHEKHGNNPDLPRFAGWWGNDENTRFKIPKNFVPQQGAAGWQTSNAPILPMAAHKAALQLFEAAGMGNLIQKSKLLTGYLEFLLSQVPQIQVLTPSNPAERGCQLSLTTDPSKGRGLFEFLVSKHVIADWREPNVIRVAPVPLYNSFEDVWNFVEIIRSYASL
jgi:kynureninase